MITYRDYLVWTTSNLIGSLSDGINKAITITDEHMAIQVLESRLDSAKTLASYENPHPETVAPKPEGGQQ